MCSGSEDLRLIDSCITQLKAQGPCRTCDESKEEEEARSHPENHLIRMVVGNANYNTVASMIILGR